MARPDEFRDKVPRCAKIIRMLPSTWIHFTQDFPGLREIDGRQA